MNSKKGAKKTNHIKNVLLQNQKLNTNGSTNKK